MEILNLILETVCADMVKQEETETEPCTNQNQISIESLTDSQLSL